MFEPCRITSANNSIIKQVKNLNTKKGRNTTKAFLLEGSRLVLDAVQSHAKIRYYIVSDSFINKEPHFIKQMHNIEAIVIPDNLFLQISETKSPQGIMAVAEYQDFDHSEILKNAGLIMAIENLQDPGNLGTIIRTADACSFDVVILSKDSVDVYNSKVIRSTMGSIFHLPVITVDDFYETLGGLKKRGISLVATDLKDALPCWETDLSKEVAIIIGNEANGLTKTILDIADRTIMIPMNGKAESFNASTAASILMYESMKQRLKTNFTKVLEKDM